MRHFGRWAKNHGDNLFTNETLDVETVLNPGFQNWTAGDADDWAKAGVDANNYVIEDESGARLVSDGSSALAFTQVNVTVESGVQYYVEVDIEILVKGWRMLIQNTGSDIHYAQQNSTVNGKTGFYFTSSSTQLQIYFNRYLGEASDYIIKYVTCRKVLSGEALGPELLTNGSFADGTTGWSSDTADLTVVDNKLQVDSTDNNGNAQQEIAVVSGSLYKLSIGVLNVDADYNQLVMFSHDYGTALVSINPAADGIHVAYFIAHATEGYFLQLKSREGVGKTGQFYNVTMKEVLATDRSIPEPNTWPTMAGDEAITLQNDRDFSGGTIGNWVPNVDGAGTVTYDATALGFAGENGSDKQGKLTSDADSYANAALSAGDVILTADKLYRLSAKVAVPAANTQKTLWIIGGSAFSNRINSMDPVTPADDTWVEIVNYCYIFSDIIGSFSVGFNGSPTDGDIIYFDDISIRPVNTSWTPWTGSTNIIEIDEVENSVKVTYVDDSNGAFNYFRDSFDISSDLEVGEFYVVNLEYMADGDGMSIRTGNAAGVWETIAVSNSSIFQELEIGLFCDNGTFCFIQPFNMGAGDVMHFRNMSIKKLPSEGYKFDKAGGWDKQ